MYEQIGECFYSKESKRTWENVLCIWHHNITDFSIFFHNMFVFSIAAILNISLRKPRLEAARPPEWWVIVWEGISLQNATYCSFVYTIIVIVKSFRSGWGVGCLVFFCKRPFPQIHISFKKSFVKMGQSVTRAAGGWLWSSGRVAGTSSDGIVGIVRQTTAVSLKLHKRAVVKQNLSFQIQTSLKNL